MVISRVENPEDILQHKLRHEYIPAGLTQLWDDTVGLRDQLSLIEKSMARLNEVQRIYNKKASLDSEIAIDVATDSELLSNTLAPFFPNSVTATNATAADAVSLARLAVDLDGLTDAIETNAGQPGTPTALSEQLDIVIKSIAYVFAKKGSDSGDGELDPDDIDSFDPSVVIEELRDALDGLGDYSDGVTTVSADSFFDNYDAVGEDTFFVNITFWQNDLIPYTVDTGGISDVQDLELDDPIQKGDEEYQLDELFTDPYDIDGDFEDALETWLGLDDTPPDNVLVAYAMARSVFGYSQASDDSDDDPIEILAAENLPVGNQIRDAISSSQANNEEARQELRRALFTWEEFVKSAGSIMERITRMIENLARGVKGQ